VDSETAITRHEYASTITAATENVDDAGNKASQNMWLNCSIFTLIAAEALRWKPTEIYPELAQRENTKGTDLVYL